MPMDRRTRSGGGPNRSLSSGGTLAWDIRQGRLIEEPTEPKLTAMVKSCVASAILLESSGSPVVKLMTAPIPG